MASNTKDEYSGKNNRKPSMQSNIPLVSNNAGVRNSHQGQANNTQKPAQFVSLYERTMSLIAKLYSLPDFEYYLFPDGIDVLISGEWAPVIDPIAILWHCFRLGAPLCHLLNQLQPKTLLDVPDVSGLVTYTNTCKKCIYKFLIGVKEELGVQDDALFTISELYKDDTNGLVKVSNTVNCVLDEIEKRGLMPPLKQLPFSTNITSAQLTDNRSRAVAELFSSERKYIESMQELMV